MSNDAKQPLEERGQNRSQRPTSEEFLAYMGGGWDDQPAALPTASEAAPFAAARRAKVAERFAGELVIIDAGPTLARSNDTEYRYRPHSAFAHLTGWGVASVPDSTLVIDARAGAKQAKSILFLRETAGKGVREFFGDSLVGEFWVGKRPSLEEVAALLAIETRSLKDLPQFLADNQGGLTLEDIDVVEFVSELRIIKDAYEIAEMQTAVDATIHGFDAIARILPETIGKPRGERMIEAAFFGQARVHGNDIGYETIAAAGSHACILHWMRNDGEVRDGELVLVDAGVEVDSFYTADVTRTMPANGKFNPVQLEIYNAVLAAADAVFEMAKPGVTYKEMHATAMRKVAEFTHSWGMLPGTVEESLDIKLQFHRRWMVHGTGHHLGLDVHDCAQARRETYHEAKLEPGMIFTIEPGLYFHENDLLAPERFRGIGVRIEDDVLVTADGVVNLSAALPRKAAEIEAWMASQQRGR